MRDCPDRWVCWPRVTCPRIVSANGPFSLDYNANYLFTDGSVKNIGGLEPMVDLGSGHECRLPLDEVQ